MLDKAHQRSREWQRDQLRRTGFVQCSELGHAVVHVLLRRGYPHSYASVGGHLAAVASRYNWQGNARLSQITRWSERTVQRARARLEEDNLISSHVLEPGELVPGQRAPVRRPQVVRLVDELQRIGWRRLGKRPTEAPRRRKRSAIDVPGERDDLAERIASGRVAAEFAQYIPSVYTAASAAARVTPGDSANVGEGLCSALPDSIPPAPDPSEIDEWERETAELERGPPSERGPPPRD